MIRQSYAPTGAKNDRVYGCVASLEDYIVRKSDDQPLLRKDRDTYYSNPELFESRFHETIAPHTSMLVNGILWDPRYPRLLTKQQMKSIYLDQASRLTSVADISCDIEGVFSHLMLCRINRVHVSCNYD